MAMNKARRTANLNNILTYDTLGNSTLIANLTVEGLTGAGFVKADAAGLLSVDTAAYTVVTGATNYLTKITAPNTLGQSLVYDNGTSVLVNTAVGVPGYSHAFQVMANGAGGLVVSTTDVASAIGIVNSSSANKTWDISPYGNHLVINESGIATRMKFDAGGNITIGDITNSGHKLEVVGSFRTTGTNTLSALQGVGDRMVVANTNGVLTTQPIPTGSITGTGAAGQVNFWTGTTTVSGSNNLFWNNAQGRLGIGTNAPEEILTISSANPVLRIRENTGVSTSGSTIKLLNSVNNESNISFSQANYTPVNRAKAAQLLISNNGTGGIVLNAASADANATIDFVTQSFPSGFSSVLCARITNAGNLLIGFSGEQSARLAVSGDTLLRGSGNTSATTALTVQNSDSIAMMQLLNNGYLRLGSGGISAPRIYPTDTTGDVELSGLNLVFNSRISSQSTASGIGMLMVNGPNGTTTSGAQVVFLVSKGFAPTSGTGTYVNTQISPVINQTGGANGITRGLYINPTLTAAADWRSVEWSNNTGWGLRGEGTAPNMLLGPLTIGEQTVGTNVLNIRTNLTGSTIYNSVRVASLALSDVTNIASAFRSEMGTQNATFTLNTLVHFHARQGSLGASSTVTNQYGFWAVSNLTGATNNYGFYGDIPSGTGRWNLYMAGTADNYLAGNLSVGTLTTTDWVNIGASTTTKAQIFLTAGVDPTTPTDGDIWATSTDIKARVAGTTYSLINSGLSGSGTAGQVTYWNSASGLTGSNNLFWDNTNSRLGIGIATPAVSLDVRTSAVGELAYFANTAANSGLIIGTQTNVGYISSISSLSALGFGINGTTTAIRIFTNSNVSINNNVDLGVRFSVVGDTRLIGSGATSATTALTVQNSNSADIFRVRNDGQVGVNSVSNFIGRTIELYGTTSTNIAYTYIGGVLTTTSGPSQSISIGTIFQPTSGTSVLNTVNVAPAINQTGGANGITRGLYVNPTLTAAADWRSIQWDNNTGWGLYGAGTAPNYMAGTLGIGAGASVGYNFVVARNITGNIESGGIRQYGAVLADVSTVGIGIRNQLNVGAGVALNSYQHYRADVFSFGAGATLVTQIGFLAENTLTNATNNYGFFGNIAAATGRWNLYMGGTANNHMAGALGIGSTALTGYSIRVSRAITGNTISSSIVTDSVIQSDVTNMAHGYYSGLYTAAASFTLDNLRHFYAEAGTFGAGSTVATQIGFGVSSNLTAATNNYGFFGGIPSGTNRWNLYMAGTANNYLNGSLLIGSATDDTVNKLQVTGTIVAGSGSSTTGSVILRGSYTAGYLTILGTDASSGGPMLSYGIQSAQNSTAGAFVSSSAIAIPRSAYVQNGGHIWYTAPSSSTAIGTAVVPTKHMELYNSGNLVLGGGADDAVNRLQVGGSAFIKGTGNTSATFGLTVQNSDSTNLLRVRNDNFVFLQNIFPLSAASLGIYHRENIGSGIVFGPNAPTTLASGTRYTVVTNDNFFPASGNASYAVHLLQPTINQTGGANGVTRGLYIIPTLTAAADWRSIQWDNNTGWGLYGTGTAPNYMAGDLAIGGTTIDANTAIQINSIKGIRINGAGGGFGYSILRGTETSALVNNGSATLLTTTNQLLFQTASLTRLTIDANGIVSINTNGQSRIISSRVGANSNGNNIFIGDGGNSAIGDVGNTLLGSGNVSLGTLNQTNVSTGYYNSSVGYGALGSVTTGFGNTAVGTTAMLAITAGSSNTALGYNAGRYFSSTGTNTNASATGSVYLGSETRASASGNSNEIVIGTSATGNGSNTATLGNTSITATYLRGNVTTNGSVVAGGSVRSEITQAAVANNVSVALLGSNITTYAAGFNMTNLGYGLNAMYAQHEQRFGGNATFAHANLNGGGLIINKLAPTAAGTVTITQQTNQLRTMSNLHLMTQFEGNNNLTVTDMSGLHIYGHYRTSGTGTITVSNAYYGIFLADPNEFGAGATVSGSNWGIYQQGAVPTNYFEGSMLIGTATTDANNKLVVAGNVRASQFRLTSLNTAPATSTSAGVLGEIRIDADNIYVCTATNTWKRAAIATF